MTLFYIYENPDYIQLAKDVMLQNTDVMVYLGNTALMNTVFFAPSNEAFTNLLPAVRLQLTGLSKEAVNRIFQYHLGRVTLIVIVMMMIFTTNTMWL